jgi:EAL domain-containing protein (putative c-di-GMP-specific phosphodiesterase class I)
LIADLGAFVLREACAQLQTWESTLSLHDDFQLHVNVSQRQLRTDDAIDAVRAILAETAVAPRRLVVEMTESFVGEHGDVARERMRELKALGVSLAIDDFGTGYSSLGYLTKLPVQVLKIDRSFVISMLDDPSAMTLVSTIISLAHALRLEVVAEGVESEEQAKILRLVRCDQMQGYLISRPIPFDDMTTFLGRHRT